MSNSTEAFDRGNKFAYDREISALENYVLVSQRERRIEVYERTRADDSWKLRTADEGEIAIPNSSLPKCTRMW
jgi:Uma2 family endonuclease